jgi:hypothetical protein
MSPSTNRSVMPPGRLTCGVGSDDMSVLLLADFDPHVDESAVETVG